MKHFRKCFQHLPFALYLVNIHAYINHHYFSSAHSQPGQHRVCLASGSPLSTPTWVQVPQPFRYVLCSANLCRARGTSSVRCLFIVSFFAAGNQGQFLSVTLWYSDSLTSIISDSQHYGSRSHRLCPRNRREMPRSYFFTSQSVVLAPVHQRYLTAY